jgi:hypothetical protein
VRPGRLRARPAARRGPAPAPALPTTAPLAARAPPRPRLAPASPSAAAAPASRSPELPCWDDNRQAAGYLALNGEEMSMWGEIVNNN